jgi:polyferredoxin
MQHFAATGTIPYYGAGLLATIGASVGRMTCGTLCPFGFLQDLLYKLNTWKGSLPGWARYLRYAALALLVFLVPYLTHQNWFSKLCPVGTLTAGLPWVTLNRGLHAMIGSLFWVKLSILLFVAASVRSSASSAGRRPLGRSFHSSQRFQLPPWPGTGHLHAVRKCQKSARGHPAGL